MCVWVCCILWPNVDGFVHLQCLQCSLHWSDLLFESHVLTCVRICAHHSSMRRQDNVQGLVSPLTAWGSEITRLLSKCLYLLSLLPTQS